MKNFILIAVFSLVSFGLFSATIYREATDNQEKTGNPNVCAYSVWLKCWNTYGSWALAEFDYQSNQHKAIFYSGYESYDPEDEDLDYYYVTFYRVSAGYNASAEICISYW